MFEARTASAISDPLSDVVRANAHNVVVLREYASGHPKVLQASIPDTPYPIRGTIEAWHVTEELMKYALEQVDQKAMTIGKNGYLSERSKEFVRGRVGTSVVLASMLYRQYGSENNVGHNYCEGLSISHNIKVGDILRVITKAVKLEEEGMFHLKGYARTGKGLDIAIISDVVRLYAISSRPQ
jgi:hypothetical protein